MTLEHMLKEEARYAEARLNRMYGKLLEEGRLDDMRRAVSDDGFRQQLFTEQAVAAANQAVAAVNDDQSTAAGHQSGAAAEEKR